jgi:hypothetical protein
VSASSFTRFWRFQAAENRVKTAPRTASCHKPRDYVGRREKFPFAVGAALYFHFAFGKAPRAHENLPRNAD